MYCVIFAVGVVSVVVVVVVCMVHVCFKWDICLAGGGIPTLP